MNKCTNCGTEFEGNFCPECGAKRQEEKICPNCGATLKSSVKFCNECGYAFVPAQSVSPAPAQPVPSAPARAEQPAPAPAPTAAANAPFFTEERLHKLYTLLDKLPVLLFALFSLLLFAFYAAPVAIAVLGGEDLFGEDMGSASLGNVYQMCGYSELPTLQGSMIALIVFAVLSFLLAGAAVASFIVPAMRERKLRAGTFNIALPNLLVYAGYAFYFIFFVVACVAFGKIGAEDGGMGMIAAGACPVLLTVFSVLFALCSVGAAVGKYYLGKKFPAFVREEREIAERNAADYAALTQRRKEERAAARAALPEPVPPRAPEAVQKPSAKSIPKPTGVLKKVVAVTEKKRRTVLLFLLPFIFWCVLALFTTAPSVTPFFQPLFGSATAVLSVLFIVILVSLSHIRLKNWNPGKIRKNGGMIAVAIFSFLLLAFSALLIISIVGSAIYGGDYSELYGRDLLPLSILCIAVAIFLLTFILSISAIAKNKKLAVDFYGTKKPAKDAQPILDFNELNADYLGYLAQKKAYREYRKALRRHAVDKAAYSYEQMRYRKGKPYEKKPPRALLWVRAHKIASGAAVVALTAAIVVACVVPASLSDIFRLGKVEQIELGFTQEQTERILGAPDEQSSSLWEYYSSDYRNKLKEIENLEKEAEKIENFNELEKLMEKAEKLEKQLEEMKYQYIAVSFQGNEATRVLFDTARCDGNRNTVKEVNSIQLSKDSARLDEIIGSDGNINDIDVRVTIGYKDGSYQLSALPASAFVSADITVADSYELEWSDGWGTYSATFTIL